MSGVAYVFPGQGSQRVGMGRALASTFPEARAVFEEADDTLGFSLSGLCFEGPEDELLLTANTQPAIVAMSVAVLRCYLARHPRPAAPTFVAGHSLGEYSALVAAGSLELADALRLVRARGQAMQQAVPVGEGAMAAVLGLSEEDTAAVAAQAASDTGGVCQLANLNAPGQIVIAGAAGAVGRAVELAAERGARRAIPLPVSAPFHCALMAPARAVMEPLIRDVPMADPKVPVVCNVDAAEVTTAAAARDALVRQIDGAVRWSESVALMATRGVERLVEIGPGKVLSGLGRRIERRLKVRAIAEPEDLAA
ncbi:MAG: ACP S-malonyltransferase [Acidobacteria bacterium]|nr:ACP S-malonyltransferase [Acidobacteriota bacterium]